MFFSMVTADDRGSGRFTCRTLHHQQWTDLSIDPVNLLSDDRGSGR